MKTTWSYNEIQKLSEKFNIPLWDYQIRIIKSRLPTVLYLIHELNNLDQKGGYKKINKIINITNINTTCNKMNKIVNNCNPYDLKKCHDLYQIKKTHGKDLFEYILKGKWDVACSVILANNAY